VYRRAIAPRVVPFKQASTLLACVVPDADAVGGEREALVRVYTRKCLALPCARARARASERASGRAGELESPLRSAPRVIKPLIRRTSSSRSRLSRFSSFPGLPLPPPLSLSLSLSLFLSLFLRCSFRLSSFSSLVASMRRRQYARSL